MSQQARVSTAFSSSSQLSQHKEYVFAFFQKFLKPNLKKLVFSSIFKLSLLSPSLYQQLVLVLSFKL